MKNKIIALTYFGSVFFGLISIRITSNSLQDQFGAAAAVMVIYFILWSEAFFISDRSSRGRVDYLAAGIVGFSCGFAINVSYRIRDGHYGWFIASVIISMVIAFFGPALVGFLSKKLPKQ